MESSTPNTELEHLCTGSFFASLHRGTGFQSLFSRNHAFERSLSIVMQKDTQKFLRVNSRMRSRDGCSQPGRTCKTECPLGWRINFHLEQSLSIGFGEWVSMEGACPAASERVVE